MTQEIALRRLAEFNPAVPSSLRIRAKESARLLPMDDIQHFDRPEIGEQRPVGGLLQGYSYIEPTDVAYAKVTPCFENGKGIIGSDLQEPTFASSEVTVLRPGAMLDQQYLSYVLRSESFRGPAIASMTGAGGLKRVDEQDMRALKVRVPPITEQRAIADYLDHETAEIDAFIEELNALFSLTNERKSATREKMLSSVVASPRQKLSWHVSFHNGDRGESYPSREEFVRSGIPFINAGNLHNGNVSFRNMNYLTKEQFHSMGGAKIRSGDVLFCLRGSVGKSGIFSGEIGALASSLVAIRTLPSLTAEYLSAWLESLPVKSQINSYLTGSAQPNLSVDQLSRLRIPVVPTTEQLRITDELARERKTVESLLDNVHSAVYLARERRAALISAAVTGQIDVTERRRPVAEVLEGEVRERA